jgi:iron complex outermembrane receptor protein
MSFTKFFSACLVGVSVSTMSFAAQAQVESEAQEDAVSILGPVVVTAQKKEENLQDVGISITAFSGEQLSRLEVTNPVDLVNFVPGLQVSGAAGGTSNSFSIRGVTQNAFASNLESPVAVYSDDSYLTLNSIVNASLFDIERVEVLRGPQGTLFGRNATGGLIHYISARPTDTFTGYVDLQLGEDGRERIETAVSGPIADKVSGRLSGVFNRDDGLIKNDIGPNAYRSNDYSVRGQLQIDPTDQLSALFKVLYSDQDDAKGGYAHVVAFGGEYAGPGDVDFFGYRDPDGDPYTGSFDFPFFNTSEILDLTATVDYDFGDFTLTSVTNSQDITTSFGEDSDVSPLSVYHFTRVNDVDQFSQELRLSYQGDAYDLLLGAYYLNIDGLYRTDQLGDVFFGGDIEVGIADQETRTWALFGQSDIRFDEQWSAVLGLRYNSDEKDLTYSTSNVFDAGGFGPFSVSDTFSEDDFSAKAQLNYEPNEDWLLYAGYNRGIKSGGFNFPLFAFGFNTLDSFREGLRFKGEVLNSYETGFKASLGRSTTLNASVFYYDYKDFQAFSFDGLATRILNVDAENYGGEVELYSNPLPGLDIVLGVSLLEAEVTGVPLAVSDGTETPVFSPSATVNGLVSYSWAAPKAIGGNFSVQLDGNWKDDHTFNLTASPVLIEKAYALLNARVGYTSASENWEIAGFVKNLTDEYYRAYSFDTSPDFGALEDVPGIPRWVGASLRFKW